MSNQLSRQVGRWGNIFLLGPSNGMIGAGIFGVPAGANGSGRSVEPTGFHRLRYAARPDHAVLCRTGITL